MLLFKLLNVIYEFQNFRVKLTSAQAELKNVAVITSADHTTHELRPVFRQNFFNAFSLQIRSFLKVWHYNFVTHEVSNCPLKQGFFAADLNNIVHKTRSLDPVDFGIYPRTKLFVRNV